MMTCELMTKTTHSGWLENRTLEERLLLHEGLGHVVLVVETRTGGLVQVVLWEVGIVALPHPDPVRVPREVVLREPDAATLIAAAVEVARDGIRVLNALALLRCLHPLDRVALGLDADAARVLEDDHRGNRPKGQERRDDPHGELLEPRPVRWVVLRKVSVVDGVEDTRWEQRPMFPLIAVVPDRLVQGVLLGRAIRHELRRRRWREVQEGRGTAKTRHRGGNASLGFQPGAERPLACTEHQHLAQRPLL
mmetsp:Transcript_45007/g.96024  ORF Transcript_45007/g.96024 Transcript_45007/m.96024 type:complete len:250 (+) Transcript_45007:1-750(+)